MKTVLLTGATGFIGRHCLAPLVSAGYKVHAVSSKTAPSETPGINWHRVDLLNSNETKELILRVQPTHLLHLAWHLAPGEYLHSEQNLLWLQAGVELLRQFVLGGGRRIVMAGTCAEYDWGEGVCKEGTTALAPSSLYGVCKHSLQLVSGAFARRKGISLAWGRIFFLFGPHEYANRLVPSVIRALLAGEVARCSHGRQKRDFLFVVDVAEAFVALLDSDVSGPVNVASGQAVSVKDIVLAVAAELNGADLIRLGAVPAADGDPPLIVGDVTRLSKEVGWAPRYTLQDGLQLAIRWWGKHLLKGQA
jgi:nucleoside-diphosphate-sugar epimerase